MSEAAVAVIRAEERLAQAHVDMDLGVITELLHPDYVILQPDGRYETRQDVLDSFAGGDRRWDRAEVTDLTVNRFGDTAVVTGRWRAVGRNGPEHFDYAARFLSVWTKTESGWSNIAYSASEIDLERR